MSARPLYCRGTPAVRAWEARAQEADVHYDFDDDEAGIVQLAEGNAQWDDEDSVQHE